MVKRLQPEAFFCLWCCVISLFVPGKVAKEAPVLYPSATQFTQEALSKTGFRSFRLVKTLCPKCLSGENLI